MAEKAASSQDANFAPALTQAFKERLRPCLNALDSLRSHGLQREISLPAIAVVGDQSVGKSSVLEAISGVEFPRGLGIVTRCPLMLSMRGREDAGWSARIRYETKSGEVKDKPLKTPAEIGQAIRDAQEEMTSSSGEISEKLIELRIEGADTPDLTLIDLPGIARFSMANVGDIAMVSKSLIMSHILKPEVLILVVIPCNVDVETVEAISLAREVDPECKRTLGVLTCPDLVNPGSETEVLALMRNERLKLSKGFVTVRCRTPQQLKDNMSLRDACAAEEEFFRQHPQFRALGEYQRGSKTLANKLSVELYHAVRQRIPEILNEIQIKRNDYAAMLEALGMGPPESEGEMKVLLVRMIEYFKKEFSNTASGTHWHEETRLFGPCRTHWETLADAIEQSAFSDSPENKGLMKLLQNEVQNQRGRELIGFDNIFPVLERLVCSHFVDKLQPHASTFLLSVTQEVDQMLRSLADRVFGQFPSLNRHIKQEVDAIKVIKLDKSNKQIKKILKQERHVFTQDRIYQSELFKPTNEKLQTKGSKQVAAADVGATALSRATLQKDVIQQNSQTVLEGAEAYVRVAVRRLQDTIPMVVVYNMLHGMSKGVSQRLGVLLTDPQPLFEMLQEENPETSSKRRQLRQLLERLTVAEQELAKF